MIPDMTEPESAVIAIVGMILAVGALIFLVIRTKVHAVLALVIAACISGLAAGMSPEDTIASVTAGFGSTLASIGLVVGFGVMMGKILEVSGAAERLALSLVRRLGKQREEWAVAGAGYIISIPIFVDSAFVIMQSLIKALSRSTGRSLLTLGIALGGGMVLTHCAVPPTPGPLAAAGIFGAPIGEMILWGLVLTILPVIGIVWYARTMGPRIEAMIERETGAVLTSVGSAPGESVPSNEVGQPGAERRSDQGSASGAAFSGSSVPGIEQRLSALPSLGASLAPILVPILLIFLNTGVASLSNQSPENWPEWVVSTVGFIGHPVIAVGIGLLLSVYGLTRSQSRNGTLADMEKGVESAGIILLVTGAGGTLGAVLRDSGTGQFVGEWVAGLTLPAILVPFLISSFVRIVQGSGTVAIITSASLSAPILAEVPDMNLALAAQAACLGALVFSYFNDSLFWVINRMLGVKLAKHQLLTWSVPTTIAWVIALVTIVLADALVA